MAMLWPGRDSGGVRGSLGGWVPAEWPQQGPVTLEAVVGEQIKKSLLVFRSDSQRQCDFLALFFLEIGKLRLGNYKRIP